MRQSTARTELVAVENGKVFRIDVPRLCRMITTASRDGSDFKPNIQELLSSIHALYAPKLSKIPNRQLSIALKIKSLPASLALAPFGINKSRLPKLFPAVS